MIYLDYSANTPCDERELDVLLFTAYFFNEVFRLFTVVSGSFPPFPTFQYTELVYNFQNVGLIDSLSTNVFNQVYRHRF